MSHNCKYKTLSVGDVIDLPLNYHLCETCELYRSDEFTIRVRYLGHVLYVDGTWDAFVYMETYICPACNIRPIYFRDFCYDDYPSIFDLAIKEKETING